MISIIIPVYNHALYTYRTIESLIENTNSKFKLIMIDDGSTDDTKNYAIELTKRLRSSFYYGQNEGNKGVHYSWNAGLRVAFNNNEDYIAIINNDLLFTKDWDLPLITALNSFKLVSPYCTNRDLPDDWPQGKDRAPNPAGIDILGACFMARTKTWREIGLFPEAMKHYFGDNWLVDRVGKENCQQVKESYIHHFFCMTTTQLNNNFWFAKDGEEYNNLKIDKI